MKELFDFRPNSRYLSFLLKQNRKLMVVLTVIFIYFLPLNFYTSNRYALGNPEMISDFNITFNFQFVLVLFILLSILIPCLLLNFIMDRNKMDTYQTLPIRKKDFYFNHFLEACLVLLIPFTIAWILGILVGYLMFPDVFNVLKWFINLGVIILFTPLLVGVSHFAFISSGRLFDGILYSGIIHVTQFFSLGIITTLFNSRLPGLSNYLNTNINSYLSFDFSLFSSIGGETNFMTIIWILIGFVLFYLNQSLYVNRKTENIEESSVYPWFLPLVTTLIFGLFMAFVYLVFLPYNGFFSSVILPFIFGLILYMIMDGIINRGFNNLYKALGKYTIISAVALAFIYGSIITGFFSMTKQIPTINSYDSILLVAENSVLGTEIDYKINNSEAISRVKGSTKLEEVVNTPYVNSVVTYLYEDEKDLLRISDAHAQLVERYYEQSDPLKFVDYAALFNTNNSSAYYGDNFTFIYLKDNEIISSRRYNLYSSDMINLIAPQD